MARVNAQTWTRLRRIELRGLANEIGNETMRTISRWPNSGEGRAVKEITERISKRMDGPQPTGSLELAYKDLRAAVSDLESITTNRFFKAELANRPLTRQNSGEMPMQHHISSVVSEIRNFVTTNPPPTPATPAPGDLLRDIIPEQKIGPVQFEFVGGVLRLHHSFSEPVERDRQNVNRAREALINEGDWLRSNLRASNADGRLVSIIEEIQTRLQSAEDIIQLGLVNITSQIAFSRFEDELPDIVSARIQGYAVGVGMYVSQFPEWVRFSENAAMADYNAADIEAIYNAGQDLVNSLRRAGSSVDPEVPHTLAWMLEAIRDPRVAARRTVFAAMRTIENLVVKVFSACGAVLGGVPSGAKAGVEVAVKGVVAIGLLTAAAKVAMSVSPASAKILQTTWLQKAGKIVLDAISKAD